MPERVLVVDDAPVNQKVLAALLRRRGLEVELASDGDEGLAAVARRPPDLLLLDVMMPGKTGFEVCEILKGSPATAEIPIIFLSALGEAADKVRGLSLGAADYIGKPFDPGEVAARVETQLRLHRLTRSLERANAELSARERVVADDLRAAADVQRALLPRAGVRLPGFSIASLFEPASSVGGDLFGALALDAEHSALWALDVSGHGVPPALVAVCAAQSLAPASGLVLRPGDPDGPTAPGGVLAGLDAEYPLERFDRFFTIAYLLVHGPTGRVRASSAGHPAPILLRRSGAATALEAGGPMIGLDTARFDEEEVLLDPGDRLAIYTDGLVEARRGDGQAFGADRLLLALEEGRAGALQDLPGRVQAALGGFLAGVPPQDDITLLVAERTAS